jgi:hypothetical protein
MPGMVDVLATAIAASDAIITVRGPEEPPFLAPERPGLALSLLGKIIGWVLVPRPGELMKEALAGSQVLPHLIQPDPSDPSLYIPDPGQGPPPDVITDPDLAERLPWLEPFERQPAGIPRSAKHTFYFDAYLEEEVDGRGIVRASSGRIGTLSARDAEKYLPHLRFARLQAKRVAAVANGHVTGRRPVHVTVRLGRLTGFPVPERPTPT